MNKNSDITNIFLMILSHKIRIAGMILEKKFGIIAFFVI